MLTLLPAQPTFLLIAQPHAGSTTLMTAIGRLLPRPHAFQKFHGFGNESTTVERRFWIAWPHSDSGTLDASQFRQMCSGPAGHELDVRRSVCIKNHILPHAANLEAMRAAAPDFEARGAFLFRGVAASVDSACRVYGLSKRLDRLQVLYHQAEAFVLGWRGWIEAQRAAGRNVTVVEYDELVADPRAVLRRLAATWGLEALLSRAKGTVNSSRYVWERALASRGSVGSEVERLPALPRENVFKYSPAARDACRRATALVSSRAMRCSQCAEASRPARGAPPRGRHAGTTARAECCARLLRVSERWLCGCDGLAESRMWQAAARRSARAELQQSQRGLGTAGGGATAG